MALAGINQGQQQTVPGLDASSGVDGFTAACGIGGGTEEMQTFTASRTGILRRVVVSGFQGLGGASGPEVNAPLTLQLVTLASDGSPVSVLAQATLPASSVGFSVRQLVLDAGVPVTSGATYAVVASSDTTQGCYGVAVSNANPYAGGQAAVSTDGGQTFTAQPGSDLKFLTVVS